MDEMDRDIGAVWRWVSFLRRRGLLGCDADTVAELVGAYSADRRVQDEIRAWHYGAIDGLGVSAQTEARP
jgi:hypothetical protein